MATGQRLDLDGDRKLVYRYVDRNGPIEPTEVAEALGIDPETFHHHLAVLKRDGLVDEDEFDGRLRVPMQRGETEQFREAGVEYAVRPARPSDLSGVIGVIREVSADAAYVVAEGVADQLAYEETLVRQTPTRSRVVFVATVADDVVGWSHVCVGTLPRLAGTAELTVGVLEAYRNHGIGSHLLQRGTEWAAARGCRKVYDSLPATNERAVAFLEANGWEIEAIRPDHYELRGELVDEVMLARRLEEVS